jgi:signal transduction histidine kinase
MPFARSLSGRLLTVTVLAVMVLEVLIFAPSIARFRQDYLIEKLRLGQVAALAILATPEGMLDPVLETELLARAGAQSIALRRGGARAMVLNALPPGAVVDATYDLREAGAATLIADGVALLFRTPGREILLIGTPWPDGEVVEVVIDEAPMVAAARSYSLRIFQLSLFISLGTATLLYLLLRRLLVRPMGELAANMAAFRENPEDAARVIRPTSRVSEIAAAETALAAMETDLREALRQRARLAALGEAVAKISHDLRNMLSTAQLLADRIQTSPDPVVARVGPKIVGSIGRAAALCESVLRFGAAKEPEPALRRVALAALLDEVGESVFPDADRAGAVRFENRAPRDLVAAADPDQLFRVLANLVRNARQAMEAAGRAGAVSVEARAAGACVEIDVKDAGPGLPVKALDNLFRPFRGGASRGGSGLGLAIAQELARMQGGSLALVSSTTEGAAFRLTLPAHA